MRVAISHRRIRLALAAVAALLLGSTLTAPAAQAAVVPPYHNDTYWSVTRTLFTQLDGRMRVDADPGLSGDYFYATYAELANGDGFYIGLQTDGVQGGAAGSTRVGKMAIFSMWGAQGADPNRSGWCVDFVETTAGKSCRVRFPWVAGHTYRTRVVRVDATHLWDGYIIDDNTGASTWVGRMAGRSTAIRNVTVNNFLERYGPRVPDCGGLARTTVTFFPPVADNAFVATHNADLTRTDQCLADRSITWNGTSVFSTMGTRRTPCDFLYSGFSLAPGRVLYTCDGRFALVHQTNGNVVYYRLAVPFNAGTGVAVLASTGTSGPTSQLAMQKDGNLVLYRPDGSVAWTTWTYGNPGAFLKAQGDGKLKIYRADESGTIWSS